MKQLVAKLQGECMGSSRTLKGPSKSPVKAGKGTSFCSLNNKAAANDSAHDNRPPRIFDGLQDVLGLLEQLESCKNQ